jgi:hypothetical protein
MIRAADDSCTAGFCDYMLRSECGIRELYQATWSDATWLIIISDSDFSLAERRTLKC